jgi:hypothetical protein
MQFTIDKLAFIPACPAEKIASPCLAVILEVSFVEVSIRPSKLTATVHQTSFKVALVLAAISEVYCTVAFKFIFVEWTFIFITVGAELNSIIFKSILKIAFKFSAIAANQFTLAMHFVVTVHAFIDRARLVAILSETLPLFIDIIALKAGSRRKLISTESIFLSLTPLASEPIPIRVCINAWAMPTPFPVLT